MKRNRTAAAIEKATTKKRGRAHRQSASSPSPGTVGDGTTIGVLGGVTKDVSVNHEIQQSKMAIERSSSISSSSSTETETFQSVSPKIGKGNRGKAGPSSFSTIEFAVLPQSNPTNNANVETDMASSCSEHDKAATSSCKEGKPKVATNDQLIRIQRQEISKLKASLKESKEKDALLKDQRKEIKELKVHISHMKQTLESVSKENVELKERMKSLVKGERGKEVKVEVEETHSQPPPKVSPVESTFTGDHIDEGVPANNTYDEAWNTHFKNLQQFKRIYGNFRVTRQYDKVLNEWVSRQRRVLCGKKKGVMNRPRLDALQRIGFSLEEDEDDLDEPSILDSVQDEGPDNENGGTNHGESDVDLEAYPDGVPASNPLDRQWNARYLQLLEYRKEHGHCRVSTAYNKALASWVIYQRQLYNGTKRGNRGEIIGMEPMRIAALNSIGMDWGEGLKTKSKRSSGEIEVTREAVDSDVESSCLKQQLVDSEQLTESNVPMTSPNEQHGATGSCAPLKGKQVDRSGKFRSQIEEKLWATNFKRLKRFKNQNGHLRIEMFNDRALFIWINRLRQVYQNRGKGGLKKDWIKALNSIGFDWQNSERASKAEDRVVRRREQVTHDVSLKKKGGQGRVHHNLLLQTEPADSSESEDRTYTETTGRGDAADGEADITSTYHKGVKESNPRDRIWNQHFLNLQHFKSIYGSFKVTRTLDSVLNEWVSRQRLVYSGKKKGDLNEARRDALNEIGFDWVNETSG